MSQDTHLRRMYKHYRKRYGHTCADCPNCIRWSISRTGHKCLCYDASQDDETNWNPAGAACGHYGKLFDASLERPLWEMYKRAPAQCPGQESLFTGRGEVPD